MQIQGLRWWIVALICFGTIINYLARNSLGVLAPILRDTLHFSTQDYSYVVGAFQLAYTVMQPVCGYIVDLVGLHAGFVLFAVLWSVFNCLHGFATGWLSLAFFRGLLGLAEAAAIPAGIKAVGEWFPSRERSVAVGWFNAGTSLGAMLAPPLVIVLQLNFGWQVAFAATGLFGFVFAALWWIFYRSPDIHPAITPGERAYIVGDRPAKSATATATAPKVAEILGARRFWGVAIPRFLAEPAWQTYSFWIPLYLSTERGMDIKQIALFAWLPFLTADLGGIVGGYMSPFFMQRFHMQVVNSRLAGIVVGALCMIGPGLIGLAPNAGVAIALFCLGGFGHQIISALINCVSADVFEGHEVATANGLTGTAAWTGGLTFSLIVGQVAGTIGYNPLFVCLTIFDWIGAAVAIALLRNTPVAAREAWAAR